MDAATRDAALATLAWPEVALRAGTTVFYASPLSPAERASLRAVLARLRGYRVMVGRRKFAEGSTYAGRWVTVAAERGVPGRPGEGGDDGE